MNIKALVIRYDLNPGLSDYRKSLEWEDKFPAHRAGLALSLDTRDEKRIGLHGSYGRATCHLYAVDADGEERRVETEDDCYNDSDSAIPETELYAALTADGTIPASDVFALYGPVWDGNNHVDFIPSRALSVLDAEDRTLREGHARVCCDPDGSSDVEVDEGWDWLDDTSDEMLEALDAAGVEWEELEEQTAIYDERQIIVDMTAWQAFQSVAE